MWRHGNGLTAFSHSAEAVEANKAPRQPTLYFAKEMGVVREAKEMASPKVAEIPVSLNLPGFCVRARVRLCLWFRHRTNLLTVPALSFIQSDATVEVVDEVELGGRHRVQVVSPVVGWASVTAGDGTVLLEKMVAQ